MCLWFKKWDGYLQLSYLEGFFMNWPDLVFTGPSFGCWSAPSNDTPAQLFGTTKP